MAGDGRIPEIEALLKRMAVSNQSPLASTPTPAPSRRSSFQSAPASLPSVQVPPPELDYGLLGSSNSTSTTKIKQEPRSSVDDHSPPLPATQGYYFWRHSDYLLALNRFEADDDFPITAKEVYNRRRENRKAKQGDDTIGIAIGFFSDGTVEKESKSVKEESDKDKIKVKVEEAADVSWEQMQLEVKESMKRENDELEDRKARGKSAEDRARVELFKLQEEYKTKLGAIFLQHGHGK